MRYTALAQETDGVFVDSAYSGSVRMLYDGYLQLAYQHFFSWDRGALQVHACVVTILLCRSFTPLTFAFAQLPVPRFVLFSLTPRPAVVPRR